MGESTSRISRSIRFDLTYEGLKSATSWSPLPIRPGFDLTYEGLKSDIAVKLRTCVRGFDLTYEGLKYGYIATVAEFGFVLILPMRD